MYLYRSDRTGGNDASKTVLAVQNMELATQSSPGNAQLWDELAVAYSRNGKFDDAVKALEHAQKDVDSTYARTPFIRGQLLQERADNIKNALQANPKQDLPKGGETDYGKLVLAAGKAFSDSIALDPSYFVDNNLQSQVEYFIDAGKPFTNTNSTVPPDQLSNVLTDTIIAAYNNERDLRESYVAEWLTK